jgi:PBSX family phage terminase large subunit
MKLKPLEASIFTGLKPELKEQLKASGVVPVNDVFITYWHNTNKINLFYGSYGSGKSVFIVDNFINHALEDKYFRCYYGRKVLEDVRGSVHKTITDQLEERRVHNLFDFSTKPNGSMNIVCKENRNEMIPFGANNTASLKSIKDPTHFFLEEMDQFTFKDFGIVYSRLRTTKALTQLYGAFNTERVFQSHWIRTMLFEKEYFL